MHHTQQGQENKMNEGLAQSHPDYTMSQAEEEALTAIEEAGHDLGAIRAYRNNISEQYTPLLDWEDWIDQFEESYEAEMGTREFAEQLADTLFLDDSSLAQWVSTYFDYEKFERDLFMGDYWEQDGYIFRSI
jgi:antirestriction protein